MRLVSLFSGIGGFDLGFEQAGMECVQQVEIDRDCQKVLAARFPNTKRFEDVTKIGKLEPADVICGGFPCQDLSVAGKRAGLAGERSGLWFEFLRIIESNLPRWIVIENVPGLLSSDGGRDFAAILRGLVQCGYVLAWRIFDAQYDGVAQRRRRVFIVGSLGDGSCAEILFESESVSWNPPTRREEGPGVAATIRGGTSGGSTHGKPNGSDEREMIVAATLDQRGRGPTDAVMMNLQVAGSLAAHSLAHGHAMTTQQAAESNHLVSMPLKAKANSSHDESHETYIYHENIDGKVYESAECPALRDFQKDTPLVAIAFAENQRAEIRTSDIAPQLSCSGGKPGSGYPAIAFGWNKSASQTMRVDDETTDALQSSPQSNPAIAFSAGQGSKARSLAESYEHTPPLKAADSGLNRVPAISNGFGVRRLTPRECMRLQGFPDSWFDGTGLSDSAMYRCLGNAVAVPVAKWIGERIMKVAAKG